MTHSIQPAQALLSDVTGPRERACHHVAAGAIGATYLGDVGATVEILRAVLATEIVCVLRFSQHSIAARGIASECVKAEFVANAHEEQGHAMPVAQRISQLGGTPDCDPKTLAMRSASEYKTAPGLLVRHRAS